MRVCALGLQAAEREWLFHVSYAQQKDEKNDIVSYYPINRTCNAYSNFSIFYQLVQYCGLKNED